MKRENLNDCKKLIQEFENRKRQNDNHDHETSDDANS